MIMNYFDPNNPDPFTLDDLLKKLLGAIPEAKAATIVSDEGLPISSALPQGVDDTKFAAMTSALVSLSEKAIIEMNKGNFEQLYIKGSSGYLLSLKAVPKAVLTVSTSPEVHLDLVLLDCRKRFEGSLPAPLIGNPPRPPKDLGTASQVQVHRPPNEPDYPRDTKSQFSKDKILFDKEKKGIREVR